MTKIGWLEHAKSNLLPLSEDENIFIKAKKNGFMEVIKKSNMKLV
ncbi:hypothetical protein [Enterococcus faecium]|nr:hypothetical protein [Enterococcus faecium]RBS29848.1 hypothetical protein EB14_02628 [Enterococcus faecium]